MVTAPTAVSPTTSRGDIAVQGLERDEGRRARVVEDVLDSSRALYIGLTETMIAPAFQAATIAITNCGTFWR